MPRPSIPRDTPFLAHSVSWTGGEPHLVISSPLETERRTLNLVGERLAFHVDPTGRFCTGVFIATGSSGGRHEPCDGARLATTGRQCERCASRDESRFMHHAHRGGHVPEALGRYLAQPHWLYIATFADGAHKVGTASDARKRVRLDEQGAVRATYVARTDDGLAVRVLEDAVTEHVGVPQARHKTSKAAALTRALPETALDVAHADCVAAVEAHLRTRGLCARSMPHEAWQPPALHAAFFDAGRGIHPVYAHPVTGGSHCLTPVSLVGSVALVQVNAASEARAEGAAEAEGVAGDAAEGAADSLMLVDLDALGGRRVTFDDAARSPESVAQHSLF